MRKIINTILILAAIAFVGVSCEGDSYQKKIDKEKKAIKRFKNDSVHTILREFPGRNHVYAKNEYYYDKGTGIYMRVIHPGNLKDTLRDDKLREVTLRFDSIDVQVLNYAVVGNNSSGGDPIKFTFGDVSSYTSTNQNSPNYMFMSIGMVLPMVKKLGRGAEVSLMIPSMSGSAYQASNLETFYYRRIIYSWQDDQIERE